MPRWVVWTVETLSLTCGIYVFQIEMTLCAMAWAFQWRLAISLLDRVCIIHEPDHTRASFERFAAQQ